MTNKTDDLESTWFLATEGDALCAQPFLCLPEPARVRSRVRNCPGPLAFPSHQGSAVFPSMVGGGHMLVECALGPGKTLVPSRVCVVLGITGGLGAQHGVPRGRAIWCFRILPQPLLQVQPQQLHLDTEASKARGVGWGGEVGETVGGRSVVNCWRSSSSLL